MLTYRLPPGTFGAGDTRSYRLTTNPQAFSSPVRLEVHVTFEGKPAGNGQANSPWTSAGGAHIWHGDLDGTLELRVGA